MMSACERCWDEAFVRSRILGGSQADWYIRLLMENDDHRDEVDQVPSPDE